MNDIKCVPESMNEVDWDNLKVGDQLQFLGFTDLTHDHWEYYVGATYEVIRKGSLVGPVDEGGDMPSENWGFAFRKVNKQPLASDFKWFSEVSNVIGFVAAVEEIDKILDSGIRPRVEADLSSAFVWSESPQRHQFWSKISQGEVPEGVEIEEDDKEETMKEFYVNILDMDKETRERFILQLFKELQDNPAFDGFIEYEEQPESWHCCRYVGVDHCGDLMFWDNENYYGVFANEVLAEDAVQDFSDGKSDQVADKTSFPDFDFKICCGDSPAVRKWLAENGKRWPIGSVETSLLDQKYLCIRGDVVTKVGTLKEFANVEPALPELDIQTVLRWSVVDEKQPIRDMIKDLEDKAEELRKQL